MSFFSKQCVDDTGKLAVKLERCIVAALVIYVMHIALSFFLTAVYRTPITGPIFSIAGLLVGIGILAAIKRDHTMTCVYIGILAIELVVGLIGTALWVVEGVVLNTTTVQAIGQPRDTTQAFYITLALAASFPIVILINLYCLLQAAKLKMILKDAKKHIRAMAIEERIHIMVQDIVDHMIPQPVHKYPQPPDKKHKQKQTSIPSDIMVSGRSSM